MSDGAGGEMGSPPTPSQLVTAMVAGGFAMPIQAKVAGGYIIYEFIGGVYDGVKMRLYPPFLRRITLGTETYAWGPPKNRRSKRFCYYLEE